MEKVAGEIIFSDYPDNKYAKKVDWWKSKSGIDLIRKWRTQGKTIKQVTEMMGVDPRTFRSWRNKYPEFNEALEVGQEVAVSRVEQSLFKRACGYEYTEEVYELVEGEMRLVREYHKHMPADVKAMLHFLFNRDPKNWRAVQAPIEETKYLDAIENILVAMKETANTGEENVVEVQSTVKGE